MPQKRLDLSLYKPGLNKRIIHYVSGSVASDIQQYLGTALPAIDIRLCDKRSDFTGPFLKRRGFEPTADVLSYAIFNKSERVNPVIFLMHPQYFRFGHPLYFWKVLRHECVHVAWRCLTVTIEPVWLFEGVAEHIAGFRLSPNNEVYFVYSDGGGGYRPVSVYSILRLRKTNDYPSKNYLLGRFWVGALARRFGWQPIRQLIASLSEDDDRDKFAGKFQKAFGTPFTKKGLQSIFRSVSKGP